MKREILKRYSDEHKLSLLIRHADKDEIPKGSFGNDVLLNKKGKQNAQSFGNKLSERKINSILTSPIGRCVQTAEFIKKGCGSSSIEIIETEKLGNPGLHIIDKKEVGVFFHKHERPRDAIDEMYGKFIQGKKVPGIPSANELNHRVTTFIEENTTQTGITIFITHDMLIAFCRYSLDKTNHTKDWGMNFLSGLIFKNGIYEGIYEG